MSEPQPPKAPEASKKSFPPATTAMSALDLMTAEAEARARREGRTQPPGSRAPAVKSSGSSHIVNRVEHPPDARPAAERRAGSPRPVAKPAGSASPWWVWVLVVAALAAVAWLVLAR